MPSPLVTRRFGLYPLAAQRGLLPIDPAKSGGATKYIGTFNLATGSLNGITQGIDVGPAHPNKLLVMVPTGFVNDPVTIEYFKINDRSATVFETTDVRSGQAVVSAICWLPFGGSQTKVKVEYKYVAASSSPTTHYVSVYNVFTDNPTPALLRKVNSLAEFARLPLGKGSKGIFCSGSGQPISLVSLNNGNINFNNPGTGRITYVGRVINTGRPVVMEGSDTDGFSLAAACWN